MKLVLRLAIKVVINVLDIFSIPVLKFMLKREGVIKLEASPTVTDLCKQFNVNPRSIARIYDTNAGKLTHD